MKKIEIDGFHIPVKIGQSREIFGRKEVEIESIICGQKKWVSEVKVTQLHPEFAAKLRKQDR
jgi:hypothetical protein